ncbi:MFS transporter [Virgibacillus sp. 179-BFC.A HS]|uniref:MFS transporter n=1 Tax=Tigheibacillus jepli TaxID=3035914 RepID=A0ABU5CKX4_9BACI|nr:MFS transporter [Virgibacillus sp. 179-BFC.A HS]MDY0407017.1 MFS transporter [Virgibacillus sp. 179-BFC.A HS]
MQKLWTKDFVVVSLENFFAYFTYYTLIATITVFVTEKFNATASMAGLSAGIFILGAVVGRLFTGNLIDRIGWKKMLYIGFIFYFITTLLYFAVTNIPFLIALRILNGAAFGVCSTAAGTIVEGVIPESRRGEGTGYYALSTTLASAIGPFLGMFLLAQFNFHVILILTTVVALLGFLGAMLVKVPKIEIKAEAVAETGAEKGFKLSNYIEPAALGISIISACIGFGFSSVLSFLTSYTNDINLVEAGSFFFITYSIAILISRPFVGRWFDLTGGNSVMYITFLLFAFGLFLLSQAHNGFILLLAGVFVGLGYGNFLSSAQAIAIKVSPKHRMGLATSTFFMLTDGGAGVGPFVLGFLIQPLGFRGMYITMAFLALVSLVLYFFMVGKNFTHAKSYR